jgi:hypothetical protein
MIVSPDEFAHDLCEQPHLTTVKLSTVCTVQHAWAGCRICNALQPQSLPINQHADSPLPRANG